MAEVRMSECKDAGAKLKSIIKEFRDGGDIEVVVYR